MVGLFCDVLWFKKTKKKSVQKFCDWEINLQNRSYFCDANQSQPSKKGGVQKLSLHIENSQKKRFFYGKVIVTLCKKMGCTKIFVTGPYQGLFLQKFNSKDKVTTVKKRGCTKICPKFEKMGKIAVFHEILKNSENKKALYGLVFCTPTFIFLLHICIGVFFPKKANIP